ncbi:MAG TPA: DUF4397 domain-containing protein [Chitinophagaceae bacterium]
MKYIKIIFPLLLCMSAIFPACKKNVLRVSPYELTEGKALFKVVYASPYFKNPGVVVRVNDEIVSSPITYATPYPGGGLNTGGGSYADYFSVKAGENTVSLSILKVGTGTDSVLLYKTPVTLTANEFQSLHITDTSTSTTSVLIKDAANKPDSGLVEYRFLNLIPNGGPLDLYFGTTKVASNIAFKQITDTFHLAAGNSLAWSLRLAGGSTTLGTAYTSASTVANQRVFTVIARGYSGPATTDIRSPKISLVYNK